MIDPRLRQQIDFILEIDRLKEITRRTYLASGNRRENTAEHSWHLAMMVLVLAEYAAEPIDVGHTMKLVLVHDIVEIDAGDTFAYDARGNSSKSERETAAADRIFGLLPPDQANRMRALWDEFEARATPEARFANVVDRLMPMLHNFYTDGKGWSEHGVTIDRVIERNQTIVAEGAPALWDFVEHLLKVAIAKGYLKA
jgi:putative hydrolase of HD superfamily